MADKLLQDVYRKIEREKILMNGARAMRSSTDNAAVQQRLDSQIRESQRNLSYLEERYNELQNRVIQTGMDSMNIGDGGAQYSFFHRTGLVLMFEKGIMGGINNNHWLLRTRPLPDSRGLEQTIQNLV